MPEKILYHGFFKSLLRHWLYQYHCMAYLFIIFQIENIAMSVRLTSQTPVTRFTSPRRARSLHEKYSNWQQPFIGSEKSRRSQKWTIYNVEIVPRKYRSTLCSITTPFSDINTAVVEVIEKFVSTQSDCTKSSYKPWLNIKRKKKKYNGKKMRRHVLQIKNVRGYLKYWMVKTFPK